MVEHCRMSYARGGGSVIREVGEVWQHLMVGSSYSSLDL
jgi:hypothetical protein